MKYKNKNYFIAVFKVYIMLLFMQISIQLDAQVSRKIKFPERMLGFHAGYSHHQSQSIGGFNFGINHEISINKKVNLHNDFSFTIHTGKENTHDGALPNLATLTATNPYFRSAPLKYVTAGIQTFAGISINMMKGRIKIGAGSILRYQTTSKPENYTFNVVVQQITSGQLYSTNYRINSIRPHRFSAGAMAFAEMQLYKTKKINTRAHLVYQLDSQGDRIFSAGIKLQKTYKKTS